MDTTQKPLKILLIGGSSAHQGGVEAFCGRAIEALRLHGHVEVTQVTTRTAFLRPSGLPGYLVDLARLPWRRDRPDCVWLQYANLFDLGYLLAIRLAGWRVAVTPHLGANWRSQSVPLLRRLSTLFMGLAHRIALLSASQEGEITLPRHVPRSIIRTFLPAQSLSEVAAPPEDSLAAMRLLHSSRLSEGKGTFLFVELCARLRDAGKPCIGRIAGGTDDQTLAELQALITARGLDGQVTLLGRLPIEDVVQEMRQADALVHLSRIDSYPLVVLEAMACGTLPVCIDLGGARDMIQTYDGHLVPEAAALDDSVAFLLSAEPSALRSRGAAIAERVRADYGWPRCAAMLEAALRELADPPAPTAPAERPAG